MLDDSVGCSVDDDSVGDDVGNIVGAIVDCSVALSDVLLDDRKSNAPGMTK